MIRTLTGSALAVAALTAGLAGLAGLARPAQALGTAPGAGSATQDAPLPTVACDQVPGRQQPAGSSHCHSSNDAPLIPSPAR